MKKRDYKFCECCRHWYSREKCSRCKFCQPCKKCGQLIHFDEDMNKIRQYLFQGAECDDCYLEMVSKVGLMFSSSLKPLTGESVKTDTGTPTDDAATDNDRSKDARRGR